MKALHKIHLEILKNFSAIEKSVTRFWLRLGMIQPILRSPEGDLKNSRPILAQLRMGSSCLKAELLRIGSITRPIMPIFCRKQCNHYVNIHPVLTSFYTPNARTRAVTEVLTWGYIFLYLECIGGRMKESVLDENKQRGA